MLMFKLALVLIAGLLAADVRYLFYNTYGDASALTNGLPSDVVAVPFGWTPAAEANRNDVLATLGISVSTLPSLVYKKSGKWTELRVFDQTSKPWNWHKTNAAISSNFAVSMVGDSLFSQMAAVQASQASPFKTAQILAVSGTTTNDIKATIANVSASSSHVLIEGGVNNFFNNTDGQIVADYSTMLDEIPAGKVAVVIGILQVDWALLNSLRPDLAAKVDNTKIANVNAQLTALCRARSNCTPATAAMAYSMAGKTPDGMHIPDAAAYQDFLSTVMPSL